MPAWLVPLLDARASAGARDAAVVTDTAPATDAPLRRRRLPGGRGERADEGDEERLLPVGRPLLGETSITGSLLLRPDMLPLAGFEAPRTRLSTAAATAAAETEAGAVRRRRSMPRLWEVTTLRWTRNCGLTR